MKGRKGLVVLIFLLSLSPFQCGRKATITIPEGLIGVWKTTAPTYADRFFEIKTDEVVFGTGEETFDTYPITKIKTEKDPKEQRTLYTLSYRSIEGQEYQFSFYYDPGNHGTITFKNQKEMAWTKEEASNEKSDDQTS